MGQVCLADPSNEKRIQELENLLIDQEKEKASINDKLEEEKERQRKYKKSKSSKREEVATNEKIEQITNEKKQVFKTMLKERKNAAKLEDEIEEYKTKISDMEQKMQDLKARIQGIKDDKAAEQDASESEDSSQKNNALFHTSTLYGIRSRESIMRDLDLPKMDNTAKTAPTKPRSYTTTTNSLKVKDTKSARSDRKGYRDRSRSAADKSDADGVTSDNESVVSDDAVIEKKTTEILDIDHDPEKEAAIVYSWLHDQKIDSKNKKEVKQLKKKLAELLTARSEGYRQTLIRAYHYNYNIRMEKDIKAIIKKGHSMDIIHGLLMTRAQYDAILISEYVPNWDIIPVADIICCRSLEQLKELHQAYKKKCKLDVKKQLQALAQKDKKKTLVKVIGSIFDFNRKEDKDVDITKVNSDLNFMTTQKNFKGESKERLVLIFTANSVQHIKVLNGQFKSKSKDTLQKFIDKKLGPKSTAGHFCKTRINYALDTPDYYAKKIKELCKNYKRNQKAISDIFLQRMETDLEIIKRQWVVKKYGDGKDLKQWIVNKSGGSKSGYFLVKMLDNCARYTEFQNQNNPDAGPSKIEKMMMNM